MHTLRPASSVSPAFVYGYLTIVAKEPDHIKTTMLSPFHELMEGGEQYGWTAKRAYDTAWLPHLQQG